MFTGLIEDIGIIRKIQRHSNKFQITVQTGTLPTDDVEIGESIAVNGVCLTVVSVGDGTFCADVSPETVEKTSLNQLKVHSPVNLERALKLSSRLGGHLVYGHVDGTATLGNKITEKNCIRMTFQLAREYNRYLVEKGSVAIDGISLTVNTVGPENFSIAVIPHTLDQTTLKYRTTGDPVNIEVDIFAKYVERLLTLPQDGPDKTSLNTQFLAKHGFI